jgi:hypothetical protein
MLFVFETNIHSTMCSTDHLVEHKHRGYHALSTVLNFVHLRSEDNQLTLSVNIAFYPW